MKIDGPEVPVSRQLLAATRNAITPASTQRGVRMFDAETVGARPSDTMQPGVRRGFESYASVLRNKQSPADRLYNLEQQQSPATKAALKKPPAPPITGGHEGLQVSVTPRGRATPGVVDESKPIESSREARATVGFDPISDTKPPEEGRAFGQADVKAVQSLLGRTEGERAFNPSYDMDGDGTIGISDLLLVLSLYGEGAEVPSSAGPTPPPGSFDDQPYTRADVDALQGAFGSKTGERAFNPAYDFDGDGVIQTADLLSLLERVEPRGTQPPPEQAPTGA